MEMEMKTKMKTNKCTFIFQLINFDFNGEPREKLKRYRNRNRGQRAQTSQFMWHFSLTAKATNRLIEIYFVRPAERATPRLGRFVTGRVRPSFPFATCGPN